MNNIEVKVYHAEWCANCNALIPMIARCEPEFNGSIRFSYIDVEKNNDEAMKDEVDALPCVIVTKDGKEVDRFESSFAVGVLRRRLHELTGN